MIRIGTAGWSIPKPHAAAFPVEGTHLQRYARCFPAVEIKSSFYRPHRPATYARWAASVAPDFRFAVEVAREITHVSRLVRITEPLDRFLSEALALARFPMHTRTGASLTTPLWDWRRAMPWP
jgi:uncharacterized protein YecE (DUF72 family)